jgi:hypothetical protein
VGQNLCPGVLDKLIGDNADAIPQIIEVYPFGFSKESDHLKQFIVKAGQRVCYERMELGFSRCRAL